MRSRCLISAAVSKPSSPGIWTSSRITAKSSRGAARAAPPRPSRRRRASGRAARGSPRARAGSRGRSSTSRTFAGGIGLTRRSSRPCGRRRASDGPDLLERQDARRRARARAPRRHLARARPSPGPARSRRRRASLDPREPARAVLVRAGEDDADQPLAVRVGRRLEEHVDRRAARSARARRSRARSSRARPAGGSRAARGRRCPRSIGVLVLDVGDRAASVRCASRSRERRRTDVGARCCATTTAASKSCGSAAEELARSASSPPQDAPITISSYATAYRSSGRASRCASSSS